MGKNHEPLTVIAIAVIAFTIPLLRVFVTNPRTLTDTVWAEDGLFPLCLVDFPLLACTLEPYAGYLNLAPRLLAIPVATQPLEHWPIVIALTSSAAVSLISSAIFYLLARSNANLLTAGFCALLPVLLPTVGFEVVATSASISWVLTYAAAIALVSDSYSKAETLITASLISLAATSTPLALTLLPLSLTRFRWKKRTSKENKLFIAVLIFGLSLQFSTIARGRQISTGDRVVSLSSEFGIKYFLGLWQLTAEVTNNAIPPAASSLSGTVFVSILTIFFALVIIMIYLTIRSNSWLKASGSLGLTALLLLGFVGFTGYANNRYLLLPSALLVASFVLGLNALRGTNLIGASLFVPAVLLTLWIPSFPASGFRTSNTEGWSVEISRLQQKCDNEIDETVAVKLTPYWFVGYTYSGAGPIISCATFRRMYSD